MADREPDAAPPGRDNRWETHAVINQVPAFQPENLYTGDCPLRDALAALGGDPDDPRLRRYGELVAGPLHRLGIEANRHPPELEAFDPRGRRIDQVRFHPAYHQLMQTAMEHGLHALSWAEPENGGQLTRSALMYLHNQAEAGTMCPVTMTHASIPALRHTPGLANTWEPRILRYRYDPRFLPPEEKDGITIGMGMTEKQGGSDVRANTTRAVPLSRSGPGEPYRITGHKWFFSAPMSDAFLILARTDQGLSCFLLPRWRPDGMVNAIRIQRLKDKLGNRSNASAEVEFQDAFAWMLGEDGRGVPTIIEMVAQTRLDCLVGSASLMRQALSQAVHHARYREAFGKPLIRQPLMRAVLGDLALESEAAMLLGLRVARAMDRAAHNEHEAWLARVVTAMGKYWVCKRAPAMICEAQECLGGAGYVEENILPRLYREAPVNAIWEGSGNIQCLDVLRAFERQPQCLDVLRAELLEAAGANRDYDAHLRRVERMLQTPAELQPGAARRLVETLTLTLQASLLLRLGHPAVAAAFCRGRLAEPQLGFGVPMTADQEESLLRRAELAVT